MSVEFGRIKDLTKKSVRYVAIPGVLAMSALSSGCGASVNETTHFPPCNQDPQTKTQTIEIKKRDHDRIIDRNRHTANVDGVLLKSADVNPYRVDIESAEGRVQVIEPGHIKFNGMDDGRVYDVFFPDKPSSPLKIQVDIIASCEKTS